MCSVDAFAKLVSDDCINTIWNAGFRPQHSGLLAVWFRQEIEIKDTRINVDLPLGADSTARILMWIERTPLNPMVVIAGADAIPGDATKAGLAELPASSTPFAPANYGRSGHLFGMPWPS
jgi:hypothetical protein